MQGVRLSDNRYCNWVKDSLGLLYTKESLEDFVDSEATLFHSNIYSKLYGGPSSSGHQLSLQPCTSCTYDNISRSRHDWSIDCPSGICQKWLEAALPHYCTAGVPDIARSNLAPQLWPSEPWEVIKLFLPFGSEDQESAKDADIQGLLKLMKNCQHFYTFLTRINLIEDMLEIRNRLMHSSKYLVEDLELVQDLQTMKTFLNSLRITDKTHMAKIEEAINKLQELEDNKLDITLNKELQVKVLLSDMQGLKADFNEMDARVKTVEQKDPGNDTELSSLRLEIDTKLKELKERDSNQSVPDFLESLATLQQKVETMATEVEKAMECREVIANLSKQVSDFDSASQRQQTQLDTLNKKQQLTDTILGNHSDELLTQKRKLEHIEDTVMLKKLKSTEPEELTGEGYEAELSRLQQHLVELYQYKCVWKNPVTLDEQDNFSQMYVQPSVRVVSERNKFKGLVKYDTNKNYKQLSSYFNLFNTELEPCRNIYITGDAGSGKTMYCMQLVRTWATAVHTGQDEHQTEDMLTMSCFTFLFYITLRDTGPEYDVVDMIKEQLMYNYQKSKLNISELLKKEQCLVIFDALDEWKCPKDVRPYPDLHPELPGRDILNRKCVFLTTTRGWKFDVLDLKTKDYDKHIELCGIDNDAAKSLAENVIHYLKQQHPQQRNVDNLFKELDRKQLHAIKTLPVLLIQMVSLWYRRGTLAESQVQLYSAMLDLLLDNAEKHLTTESEVKSKCVSSTVELPDSFDDEDSCQNHKQLLLCLSKLAFESLFNKDREDALVFKRSKLKVFEIGQNDIQLCLQCGILSQNKDTQNFTGRFKKLSFLHKKLQEFLAALYLVTCDDFGKALKHAKTICKNIQTFLEMSQVFMFVAGLNPDRATSLLESLVPIVSTDSRIKTYRHTIYGSYIPPVVTNLQLCYNDCIVEAVQNDHDELSIPLEDIVIDKTSLPLCGDQLLNVNTNYIKSLFVSTNGLTDDQEPLLNNILEHLHDTHTLQTLYIKDTKRITPSVLSAIINNSENTLRCLELHSVNLTSEILDAIRTVVKHLETFELVNAKLTHEQAEDILTTLSDAKAVKHLHLRLNCTTHGRDCRPMLDLTGMNSLKRVEACYMTVDNLRAAKESIEDMIFHNVSLSETTLTELVTVVYQATRAVELGLRWTTITSDNEEFDLKAILTQYNMVVISCEKYGDKWFAQFHTQGAQLNHA